jgi:SAM-dependent methyltransferase
VRNALYRVATLVDRLIRWKTDTLLPPAHLRVYYYGTWNPQAFTRASQSALAELLSRGLRPEHRVLDIGSGIGNLAVSLRGYLHGGYDGIDIHREAVAWCQETITPRYPAFRFHHADLASLAYNPKGSASASTYRFPFADESFDFILLGSVFTHMLPDGVEQYVREISRLLTRGGVCVASFFLLNEETRPAVYAGRSFMSFGFEHASGVCRVHSLTKPEAAVAFDESFVRCVHEEAGLLIRDVRRGKWWSGEAHDQDVLTIVPSR